MYVCACVVLYVPQLSEPISMMSVDILFHGFPLFESPNGFDKKTLCTVSIMACRVLYRSKNNIIYPINRNENKSR